MDAENKVNAIYDVTRSPTNELYALFLSYTVNVFDEVILGLQEEDPKVHVLRRMLHKMIRKLLNRCVKPSAMIGKSVGEVQCKRSYNITTNNDLVIEDAKLFINHLRQNCCIILQ